MELKGVLKQIHPTETRGEYSSRKIWLTLDPQGQYPQTIELEVSQKNLNLFNNIAPGTWVTCSINVRGREWTNKEGKVVVFNTLQVWKVEVAGKAVNVPATQTQHESMQGPATQFDDQSDAPF